VGCALGPVEPRGRGALTPGRSAALGLLAAATLIIGFAAASITGVRILGAVVLVLGGAVCVVWMWRQAGPARAVIALVVALAAFAVSHPLGEVIGSWPAVLAVALVTGLVVWGLALRRASA
jgi:hypothetical protein